MNTENTTHTTNNTETSTYASHGDTTELQSALTDLARVGYAWAAHGLNIGKSALEISAQSTGAAARVLGEIAKAFEARR